MTVLLYDGPLLCGFNVAIKGLNSTDDSTVNGREARFAVLAPLIIKPPPPQSGRLTRWNSLVCCQHILVGQWPECPSSTVAESGRRAAGCLRCFLAVKNFTPSVKFMLAAGITGGARQRITLVTYLHGCHDLIDRPFAFPGSLPHKTTFDLNYCLHDYVFLCINHVIATLKPQSNGPSYSNTVIGTLAVDGWAV